MYYILKIKNKKGKTKTSLTKTICQTKNIIVTKQKSSYKL